jgi:hypothetical protein
VVLVADGLRKLFGYSVAEPKPAEQALCQAESSLQGSDRQIRGEILRLLLASSMKRSELGQALAPYEEDGDRVGRILQDLVSEGFVERQKSLYKLA